MVGVGDIIHVKGREWLYYWSKWFPDEEVNLVVTIGPDEDPTEAWQYKDLRPTELALIATRVYAKFHERALGDGWTFHSNRFSCPPTCSDPGDVFPEEQD